MESTRNNTKSNSRKPSSQTNQFRRGGNQMNSKKKKVSSLNPNHLIKEAVRTEKVTYVPKHGFEDFKLSTGMMANIKAKGYNSPTEIQEATIIPSMEGRNVLGIANTGTGKTAAFLIPIIEKLVHGSISSPALVIVPTRELALQVEEEFRSLSKGMRLNTICLIGGTNINADIQKLRNRLEFVVGTPGRLLDLSSRGALTLKGVEVLVLDEFDKMLDMGFIHDIKRLIGQLKSRKQTFLFSATLDNSQQSLVNEIVHDPVVVKISSGVSTGESIEQQIIRLKEGEDKFAKLKDLLSDRNMEKVILFTETKHLADRIGRKLNQNGISASLIHGNKSQNYRVKAIESFRNGHSRVLVATDVAARGLDIDDVTHVINYQLPMTMDSYIHRIGRTGRAGKFGMAYTFID